jgi:hypothetical protein
MSRNFDGIIIGKSPYTIKQLIEREGGSEEEIRQMNQNVVKHIKRSYIKERGRIRPENILKAYIKVYKTDFYYAPDKDIEKLVKNMRVLDKAPVSQVDEDDEKKELKQFIKDLKENLGEDSSSDDEPKKKGEGIKRGPGRPKKIVMKSYSSSSDEEDEKTGMGLKVKRGRPITVKGHKKCSCGSGLDVEPYKKFFTALKENTALK